MGGVGRRDGREGVGRKDGWEGEGDRWRGRGKAMVRSWAQSMPRRLLAPSARRGSRRFGGVMKSAGCLSHYSGRILETDKNS